MGERILIGSRYSRLLNEDLVLHLIKEAVVFWK